MTPADRALALGAATAALIGAAGCTAARDAANRAIGPNWEPAPLPPASPELERARLALNRAAFGPAPGEIASTVGIGPAPWLEQQLSDSLDEGMASKWRSGGLETVEMASEAPDRFSSLADGQLLGELQQAAILRAVYSRRQLHEVMVDFWTNHFNIYALKAAGRELLPGFIETVVRPHALGNFRTMLLATARSPAMLTYLDNERNRKGVVNENYARELMELHTVGVRGGYAHTDIRELARILTGWTVAEGFARGRFRYERAMHDVGAKQVPFLDIVVPAGGGMKEAEAVMDRLARHPSTARYLASKLCRRILGHAPEDVAARAASAYLRSDCEIRPALRPILLDALATRGDVRPSFKRPFDYVVSALRAYGADTDGGPPIHAALADMGQPLFQWPMPDGFPERAGAWTGNLLPRWNFALDLCQGRLAGSRSEHHRLSPFGEGVTGLVEACLGRRADDAACRKVIGGIGHSRARPGSGEWSDVAALALCSPAFQWRG